MILGEPQYGLFPKSIFSLHAMHGSNARLSCPPLTGAAESGMSSAILFASPTHFRLSLSVSRALITFAKNVLPRVEKHESGTLGRGRLRRFTGAVRGLVKLLTR